MEHSKRKRLVKAGWRIGSTADFLGLSGVEEALVDMKLTHSVIASLVGLTRETTTNELSKLKTQKVLRYNAHQYSIDKAKLERLVGEDSFEDVVIAR